jgi:hypothetical protein
LKAPIVCDTTYGGEMIYLSDLKRKFHLKKETEEQPIIKRVALHAHSLTVRLVNEEIIKIEAPYPKDFDTMSESVAKEIKRLHGINYVIPPAVGTDFNNCGDISSFFLSMVDVFSIEHYLNDKSPVPQDLISPRILVPNGMCLFGGAPKVGKSDFILSWLMHMAAGVEFMGMAASRPLKIFYLQAEIGYFYIRERIENVDISPEALEIAKKNMLITPRLRQVLDADGVAKVGNTIRAMGGCDIIAIDPLRNLFDGESENDNAEMMRFLLQRVEALRPYSGGECGIVMVHHTKKVAKDELMADPFLAFSGASSLRGFYNTGIMMYRPDEDISERVLAFELRDGKPIDKIHADKQNGRWYQIHKEPERASNPIDERLEKIQNLKRVIAEEARHRNHFTVRKLSEFMAGRYGFGASRTNNTFIQELITQGELATDFSTGRVVV